MNIYLIGYRCTGKTTIGTMLSDALNYPVIDADVKLVEDNGMTVAEIVEKEGWGGFRQKEKNVLKEISKLNRFIIATGGGVILDPENVAMMKKSGVTIWLKATPGTIYNRMIKDQMTDEQRPALTDKKIEQEIIDTLEERLPLYEGAMDFSVDTDNLTLKDVTHFILEGLKGRIE